MCPNEELGGLHPTFRFGLKHILSVARFFRYQPKADQAKNRAPCEARPLYARRYGKSNHPRGNALYLLHIRGQCAALAGAAAFQMFVRFVDFMYLKIRSEEFPHRVFCPHVFVHTHTWMDVCTLLVGRVLTQKSFYIEVLFGKKGFKKEPPTWTQYPHNFCEQGFTLSPFQKMRGHHIERERHTFIPYWQRIRNRARLILDG